MGRKLDPRYTPNWVTHQDSETRKVVNRTAQIGGYALEIRTYWTKSGTWEVRGTIQDANGYREVVYAHYLNDRNYGNRVGAMKVALQRAVRLLEFQDEAKRQRPRRTDAANGPVGWDDMAKGTIV